MSAGSGPGDAGNREGPLRVGVIGAGVMGADHASTLHRFVSGARVRAVANVDRFRAERVAVGLPGCEAASDARAMVLDPEVDAVVIASSDDTHSDFVRLAPITGSAIHECDLVPWLLGSPVVEVGWQAPRTTSLATGLQDPQVIRMRTADGVLTVVEVFLNARYGYDMRCEVVGETGAVSLAEPVRVVTDSGGTRATSYAADWRPRFADAYRLELQAWVDSVVAGTPSPLATVAEAVAASAVAEAVLTSMRDGGRPTTVQAPVLARGVAGGAESA